jgi:hypothetical protein
MQLVHQRKEAVPGPIEAASAHLTNPFTLSGEHPDFSGSSEPMHALQRLAALLGLQATALCGSEVLLSGRGMCQTAPDARAARVFLRQLAGRLV